jgi:hypothetical protein
LPTYLSTAILTGSIVDWIDGREGREIMAMMVKEMNFKEIDEKGTKGKQKPHQSNLLAKGEEKEDKEKKIVIN